MVTPTSTAIAIAASPTASEMRPPYSMRAKMSCPRSSVPNGCDQDGPLRRAPKSISLIATFHTSGPNTTSATIVSSTTRLTTAILCRQKRRHASRVGEM